MNEKWRKRRMYLFICIIDIFIYCVGKNAKLERARMTGNGRMVDGNRNGRVSHEIWWRKEIIEERAIEGRRVCRDRSYRHWSRAGRNTAERCHSCGGALEAPEAWRVCCGSYRPMKWRSAESWWYAMWISAPTTGRWPDWTWAFRCSGKVRPPLPANQNLIRRCAGGRWRAASCEKWCQPLRSWTNCRWCHATAWIRYRVPPGSTESAAGPASVSLPYPAAPPTVSSGMK